MSRQSTGYVYFVHAPINGLIKIGFSRESPDSRLSDFQRGSPVPIERLGIIRAGIQFEGKLHRRFAHLNSHGEWFKPGDDLMAFVREWAWPWTNRVSAEDLAGIPSKYHREAIEVGSPWEDPHEVKLAAIRELRHASKRNDYRRVLLLKRADFLERGRDIGWIDRRLATVGCWPELGSPITP